MQRVSHKTKNRTEALTIFVGLQLPLSSLIDLLLLRSSRLASSYAFRHVMKTIRMHRILLDLQPMVVEVGDDVRQLPVE
jgi:hypothetical protein